MASSALRLLSTPNEGLTSTISLEFVLTCIYPDLLCRAQRWQVAGLRRGL